LLGNPAYTGAYVFGRYHSGRVVERDGRIHTRTVERPQSEWSVIIQGHHPAYIGWETFLTNRERLAANDTRHGARPPREGTALLQGIVLCGSCGRAMQVLYSSAGRAMYDCTHARSDHTNTSGCRSIIAAVIDDAVVQRLLAVVTPPEIALVLAAADEVMDRRTRSTRALELRVERARYDAARAERAFHHCEPENRLVARSLEHRWEEALTTLAEAEAALAAAQAAAVPLPARAALEALATDLPQLWAAPTTSHKDRKRLLRTLVADVTLKSALGDDQVRIGIRWRSGATEEVIAQRPVPAPVARRTPSAAIDFVRRHRACRDQELVAALNATGLRTGTGRPFDETAVRWIRFVHRIPLPPAARADGELTVAEVAARLGIARDAVYYWIERGHLTARRDNRGALYVRFSADLENACRQRVMASVHLKPRTPMCAVGGAV
jgi:excisionase family DNA binding protein